MKTNLKNILSENTFFGILRLVSNVLLTKIYFSNARLIRFPIYIKGKKRVKIGENFTCGIGLRLDCLKTDTNIEPQLIIGSGVEINDYVHIGCTNHVLIGNNVLIASKVFITDHNHGIYSGESIQDSPLSLPKSRIIAGSPVHIEENVWIGEMVTILPGVRIGKGSIIGANSVVSKNIPPYSIAVGIPAKVIKYFNFESEKWISL
ncbi:DapH/DapD/GlmU-related protein [Dyadobacter sp. LHD-138]|uniref:DapH/DapD/GlmU-related protein n=1 Tax=Dyadobacter sp. LHD-138 TaxID=3071413 RepID=UPI0027E0B3D7|nr:DapH/DapD/GlmU-related protein [Dyadobacter sp. LHD-138]MDQ6481886.1 DapH/DapD/GlmU-related protein [Dyadobacter sp. LHD-138]